MIQHSTNIVGYFRDIVEPLNWISFFFDNYIFISFGNIKNWREEKINRKITFVNNFILLSVLLLILLIYFIMYHTLFKSMKSSTYLVLLIFFALLFHSF